MSAADERLPREFELIARFFDWPSTDPNILIDVGDDAALVMPSGATAVATDTLVAGVHFLETIEPARLGERVLAVNLSDMAAMGAKPRWFTLALTMPHSDADWLSAFASGLRACAERYDIALIGGDVTTGPLCLSVHILGEVDPGDALRRSGAGPDDAVYVTGTLGDAAAGLELARAGRATGHLAKHRRIDVADAQYLLDRYEIPTPRVGAGIALRGVAHAAIDVSDGLLGDLGRLCAASGCGARVDVQRLPLSDAVLRAFGEQAARELALGGGDDYELCFTAPRAAEPKLMELFAALDVGVTRIGQCQTPAGVDCRLDGAPFAVERVGYEHFG